MRMQMRRETLRSVVFGLLAIAVAGCFVLPSALARHTSTRRFTFITAASSPGALRVVVGVTRPTRLRFTATERSGGAPILVADPREVFTRHGGIVSIPLNRVGRELLGACTTHGLVITGSVVRSPGGAPGVSRSRSITLGVPPNCTRTDPKPVTFATPKGSRCEFIATGNCLFPFPSDYYTVPDPTSASGRRLALDQASMPRNIAGLPIAAADYNRLDGFSPGESIIAEVPGLQTPEAFRRSGVVPETDMGKAYAPTQPVVVIDAATRARHLVWAELDATPGKTGDVTLIIRPGRNFTEGHRYIVALRHLRAADGTLLPALPGFRLYRDRTITNNPLVEQRRGDYERMFRDLGAAGIGRDDLDLAWDFTVASQRSLSGRMLSIRDRAFAALGDRNLADLKVQGRSPSFHVDQIENLPSGPIARNVEGRVTVPCFLNLPGCVSGSRFNLGSDGLPIAIPGNTMEARFTCHIPRSGLTGAPLRPSLYGHGLLGSRGESNQGQLKALGNDHGFMFCATNWSGMSCADVPSTNIKTALTTIVGRLRDGVLPQFPDCDLPNVATILLDASNFPTLGDRVQQGMLNFLFLGRAMIHPEGFSRDPAFRIPAAGGGTRSVIDTKRLFYDGNSQGSIIGGALTAVAPDFDRAVLGVPGMNYSTLLQRSKDFDTYAQILYKSYPDQLQRPLILALLQLLWDPAETDGYALHMTGDPLPNTPAHHVILHAGLGDHQVAQVTAETEARTIGAHVRTPYVDSGRSADVHPAFGLRPILRYPFDGSALVLWDIGPLRMVNGKTQGTDVAPTRNTPPRRGEDPHEAPRNEASARRQKSAFLRVGGRVINVCGRRPCYAAGWPGPKR